MNLFSTSYRPEETDHSLIRKILEGDENALTELINIHQPYIFNIAWKMIGDPSKAEDLMQESLLKIISNLSSFKFESSFRTWAYRIVRNHFLNDTKKPSEVFANNFDDLGKRLDAAQNIDLDAEQQWIRREEIREVRLQCLSGMLLCLTRQQRMIYIIGEVFGADHNVGSEIMQLSKSNYRMKLSKARKDLHHFMQQKCGLVDQSNPCRCHKKVTVALEEGMIDAKNLLFNKREYSTFKNELESDANYLTEESEMIYADLHRDSSFKTHFHKKNLIEEILASPDWSRRLNLQ